MKAINIDIFDRDSITRAKEKLAEEQKAIGKGSITSVQQIIQMGYDYLMTAIPTDTGELKGSVSTEFDEKTNTGKISIGANYAIFVEYGTGIVGMSSPHPELPPGWSYDHNGHFNSGWVYYDKAKDKYVHTKGQLPQAFVYKTKEYMKSIADPTLKVTMAGG